MVVAAILRQAEPAVLTALAGNPTAELNDDAMRALVAEARRVAALRSPLAQHPRLTSELALQLYVWLGQAMRQALLQALHLLPLWMPSGALFPASGASGWLRILMQINPLTYGVDALRSSLDPAAHTDHSLAINLAVTLGFCLVTFATSWAVVNRRTRKPAA